VRSAPAGGVHAGPIIGIRFAAPMGARSRSRRPGAWNIQTPTCRPLWLPDDCDGRPGGPAMPCAAGSDRPDAGRYRLARSGLALKSGCRAAAWPAGRTAPPPTRRERPPRCAGRFRQQHAHDGSACRCASQCASRHTGTTRLRPHRARPVPAPPGPAHARGRARGRALQLRKLRAAKLQARQEDDLCDRLDVTAV
jgi:hypothetical protein